MAKIPQLDNFPIDSDTPLQPDKALFVGVQGSIQHTFTITDVTDTAATSSGKSAVEQFAAISIDGAKVIAAGRPVFLRIYQKSLLSSDLQARDDAGAVVAELSNALLSFGKWSVSFPADSPHCSHTIEMKPVNTRKRVYGFAQESVPYFWDMMDHTGAGKCALWKVVEGRRAEVARFWAKRARDREGVLVLDGTRVDEVVATATCVAIVNRVDSFELAQA